MNNKSAWLGFFLVLSLNAPLQAQTLPDSLAREFLDLNRSGQFAQAMGLFDASIKANLSPTLLSQVWKGLENQYGSCDSIRTPLARMAGPYLIEIVSANFQKALINISLAFNQSNRIVGYHILGIHPLSPASGTPDTSRYPQQSDTLHTKTGDLFGTLMFPQEKSRPLIALIIAGSGPTDRNGNNPLGEQSNAYKLLAEGLAGGGIASLRYDKRGIGASRNAMKREQDLRFSTYVDDAESWIRQLQQDTRFGGVVVIGHSEGSLVGILASEQTRPLALVSLAGAGERIGPILLRQLESGDSALVPAAKMILRQLQQGRRVDTIPSDPLLTALFRPSIQPYLISWMKIDPSREIARLPNPVLIINGTRDLQVLPGQARLLSRADPRATLLLIPHMNHILKDAPADRKGNLQTYQDPALPLSAPLVPAILGFLKSRAH